MWYGCKTKPNKFSHGPKKKRRKMCHPVRGSTVTTMLKGMLSRSPSQPAPYSFYDFKTPNGVCGPAPIFTVLGGPASVPPRSRFGPASLSDPIFTVLGGPASVPPPVPPRSRPIFYSTWWSRLGPASVALANECPARRRCKTCLHPSAEPRYTTF